MRPSKFKAVITIHGAPERGVVSHAIRWRANMISGRLEPCGYTLELECGHQAVLNREEAQRFDALTRAACRVCEAQGHPEVMIGAAKGTSPRDRARPGVPSW